jgi:hypothetical protein
LTITGLNGGIMTVDPLGDLTATGMQGGPFTPTSQTYIVSNTGSLPFYFSVSRTQPWVTLSQTSGELLPGQSTLVVVSFNHLARLLTAVAYPATFNDVVTFTNTTSGVGNTTRNVALTLSAASPNGVLLVAEQEGLTAAGMTGGPFTPGSRTYTLHNVGLAPMQWRITHLSPWVNLSASTGTLAAMSSTTVTVSLNEQAAQYQQGSYNDTLTFSNLSTAAPSETRQVSLNVSAFDSVVAVYKLSLAVTDTGNQSRTATKYSGYLLTDRKYQKATAVISWKQGSQLAFQVEDWSDVVMFAADDGRKVYEVASMAITDGDVTTLRVLSGAIKENFAVSRLVLANVAPALSGTVSSIEVAPSMQRDVKLQARIAKPQMLAATQWDMSNAVRLLKQTMVAEGYQDLGVTTLGLSGLNASAEAVTPAPAANYVAVYKLTSSGKTLGQHQALAVKEGGFLVTNADQSMVRAVVTWKSGRSLLYRVVDWNADTMVSQVTNDGRKSAAVWTTYQAGEQGLQVRQLVGPVASVKVSGTATEVLSKSLKGFYKATDAQATTLTDLKMTGRLDAKATLSANNRTRTVGDVVAELVQELENSGYRQSQ